MSDGVLREQRISDGDAVYLVRDEGLRNPEDEFYAWLESQGFRKWSKKGYFGEPYVWVNTGNKLFAPGMPGIKLAEPVGDDPIGIAKFKAIYKASMSGKA